jgi:hypothetical protein
VQAQATSSCLGGDPTTDHGADTVDELDHKPLLSAGMTTSENACAQRAQLSRGRVGSTERRLCTDTQRTRPSYVRVLRYCVRCAA